VTQNKIVILSQTLSLALIGLSGFDHCIRNYDQIDNDVGFYYVFNTPRTDEFRAILEARWQSPQISMEDNAGQMLEEVTHQLDLDKLFDQVKFY